MADVMFLKMMLLLKKQKTNNSLANPKSQPEMYINTFWVIYLLFQRILIAAVLHLTANVHEYMS